MYGVEHPPVRALVGAVEPRQEVVGAPCPATQLTVGGSFGVLISGSVGLLVQGCSGLEIHDCANRVPTLLGAHSAEVSGLVNVLPVVQTTIALRHHQPAALFDSRKTPAGLLLAEMKSETVVGWMVG
jgi:hypothetical protein